MQYKLHHGTATILILQHKMYTLTLILSQHFNEQEIQIYIQ